MSVMDSSSKAFDRLGPDFAGTTHVGTALDVDALRDAEVAGADVFIAATGSDNANAAAVQVVRRLFDTPVVAAWLADAGREETYRTLEIDHVTSVESVARGLTARVDAGEG